MSFKSIVLMGIKHCGKSTQARLLAKYYSVPSYDTDDLVTELTGKSPREIYSTEGKDAFMAAEVKACQYLKEKILADTPASISGYGAVVATGGGICNNNAAVEILESIGILVFLNSSEDIAVGRIIREVAIHEDGSLGNLPAYIAKENPRSIDDVKKSFHNFYMERQKIYKSICSVSVEMKPVSKAENMDSIIEALARK